MSAFMCRQDRRRALEEGAVDAMDDDHDEAYYEQLRREGLCGSRERFNDGHEQVPGQNFRRARGTVGHHEPSGCRSRDTVVEVREPERHDVNPEMAKALSDILNEPDPRLSAMVPELFTAHTMQQHTPSPIEIGHSFICLQIKLIAFSSQRKNAK